METYSHNHEFLPKSEILTFEDIVMIIKSMIPLGLKKVRITGGEPLLRKDITKLISMIRNLSNELDIALTTNGTLLSKFAKSLYKSGLDRVTVSIDAIDSNTFQKISNSGITPDDIISGINAAKEVGLTVKINTVIIKNKNVNQIIPLVNLFSKLDIPLRFIEYMDVGGTSGWNLDQVISGNEMRDIISKEYGPMEFIQSDYFGEVSRNWQLSSGYPIGFIESISNPFCSTCTRARISANGNLYTCLFSELGNDLKSLIKLGANSSDMKEAIKSIWNKRSDRYSEIRDKLEDEVKPVEMHYIGG